MASNQVNACVQQSAAERAMADDSAAAGSGESRGTHLMTIVGPQEQVITVDDDADVIMHEEESKTGKAVNKQSAVESTFGPCWGWECKKLLDEHLRKPCNPDFVPGKKRLTDKFCIACRTLYLPYAHVRAVASEQADKVHRTLCRAPRTSWPHSLPILLSCAVPRLRSVERLLGKVNDGFSFSPDLPLPKAKPRYASRKGPAAFPLRETARTGSRLCSPTQRMDR